MTCQGKAYTARNGETMIACKTHGRHKPEPNAHVVAWIFKLRDDGLTILEIGNLMT